MTSVLMAAAGIVALVAAPLGVRWLVHWRHQENHAQHAAGAVVPAREPEPDWLDAWLPAPLGHALGSIRTYDPVPWEDLQFHGLGEDPGPGVVPSHGCPPGPVQDGRGAHGVRGDPGTRPIAIAAAHETGVPPPTRLATAADVDAARPWLDVQLEDLYVWVRGVLAA